MRAFTPSGSRLTSMPPTVAVPDEGASSPHSMRIVVDLPAPLLPRKPKISPRRTSNETLSTATNWPKRRVRPRTSIAVAGASARTAAALASNGALQPGLGEADIGGGARPIQFGLQARDLRVEHVGRRRHARAVAFADHALGLRGGAHAVIGRAHRLSAGREFQAAGADLEGHFLIEGADARAEGGGVRPGFSGLGAATAAVPQRPRHIDRGVPRRGPDVVPRKVARLRIRVVEAAADADLRQLAR